MNKSELKRLIKIEDNIYRIALDELKLKFYPIEFDIIPPQKMFEIMAYHLPTNISNWKFGRDYERWRTLYEHGARGLPYEVVTNSLPAKAYLMNNNKFGVHCLVIAHVVGHSAFFATNRYFTNSRQDIISILFEASRRFLEYEHRFGIDEVERIQDAGHALQWHSSPFEPNETEEEKRRHIFEQKRKAIHSFGGDYSDVSGKQKKKINEDVELFNQKLWRALKLRTPVEPTEDLLRYIIDNSIILEDWQKDILEVLRVEGRYYWPIMKTRFMNEGMAVVVHEKIMKRLFEKGLLSSSEHADFNYSNSLVKSEHSFDLNPYLLGSGIWYNIEDRWNKGRHNEDYEQCGNSKEKESWDTNDMVGWEKCLEVMETYTDWFFIQDFLTPELVRDLKVYVYAAKDTVQTIDYIITKDKADEIRRKLIYAFAQQMVPKIEITDGNNNNSGEIILKHKWDNAPLEEGYAKETMKHINRLWGRKVYLHTKDSEGGEVVWGVGGKEEEDEEEPDYMSNMSDFLKTWTTLPLEQTYLVPF